MLKKEFEILNSNATPRKIMVVGDIMLDRYYIGAVERISPEAPVPVFLKKEERLVLGGAANVANNLVGAGQEVILVSVTGRDAMSEELLTLLRSTGCYCEGIIKSESRVTGVKTRLLAQNNQQLLRLDEESTDPIQEEDERRIVEFVAEVIDDIDAVLLSDYLKGVLTPKLTKTIISIANDRGIPVMVDVKDSNVEKYKNALLLKPNRRELSLLTGMSVETDEEIVRAAHLLRKRSDCKYVLATLGSKGMILVGNTLTQWISSIEHEVYDVSGAGDTVIAYLMAGYVNGLDIIEAAHIANCAAGVKVTKTGTAPVLLSEVAKTYHKTNDIYIASDKVVLLDTLLHVLEKQINKKVVFTNGCFDILHLGHIGYLRKAASYGDILIVGLNSDSSVRRLKGKDRPINKEKDRAEILGALEFVDYVVIFDENTPLRLIEAIKPDVLVKGSDYQKENVVGAEFVEDHGGSVELVPILDNHSTTDIINKIERK